MTRTPPNRARLYMARQEALSLYEHLSIAFTLIKEAPEYFKAIDRALVEAGEALARINAEATALHLDNAPPRLPPLKGSVREVDLGPFRAVNISGKLDSASLQVVGGDDEPRPAA